MLEGALARACEEALARRQVPGAAIGVLAGDRAWTAGFGVLDVRSPEPVAPDSRFRIASVTKPFTATLALHASLSGEIGLDEEVPGPVQGVTVRHLLSHLGGFEGECGDLARFGGGDDALALLVADLDGQRAIVPPGELWSYCNAGYWLLAHFLAERLGTSYEGALHDRVLQPLRLECTGFGPPEATGHELGQPVADSYPRARNASGGLVSTVSDLLAFAGFHLDERAAAALRVPVVETPGGWYGFGLSLERVGDLDLWGHEGDYGGFRSRLVFAPERRFAFAGLTNAATGRAALEDVLDVALAEALGVRREQPPTTPRPAAELRRLAGRYARPELELDVRAAAGGLELDAVEIDRVTGARARRSELTARPLGRRLYVLEGGDWDGARFDFHPERGVPRFVRIGSRLTPRINGG
ncbi:MAG: beta-lactamase [Gaiellaceae bacterium]|nr:beta-lactamase [Gaiellaceae bacterium]